MRRYIYTAFTRAGPSIAARRSLVRAGAYTPRLQRLHATSFAARSATGGTMSDVDRSAAQRLMTLDRSGSVEEASAHDSTDTLRQMKEFSKRPQTSVTMRTLLDTADGILLETTPPQAQPRRHGAGKTLSQCERTLLQVIARARL